MPQLLHFLRIESKTQMTPSAHAALLLRQEASLEEGQRVFRNALNEDIDWGTVDIFTCTKSCQPGEGCNAVEEAVRIQAPPTIARLAKAATTGQGVEASREGGEKVLPEPA
jgi:hypothetical protein